MQEEMKHYYVFNYCTLSDFKKKKYFYLLYYNKIYMSFARLMRGVALQKIFRQKILTGVHCHWEYCNHSSIESAIRTAEIISSDYMDQLQKAQKVAAISLILYGILKKQLNNIYYVPHAIDPKIYYPEQEWKPREMFHVGWAQSETNHGFKRRVKDIEAVCSALDGVKLDKIGNENTKLSTFDSMRKWYNSLDCYVCFSIFEGGPLPIMEAMACGIPCISTPVGQVPEIIIDGVNGFIVETKEGLKEKIELLKSNHELRKMIAQNARSTMVEKRRPEVIAPYWKAFFE